MRSTLFSLTSTLFLSTTGGIMAENTNFIIIHLDDMGYGDLSITGAIGYTTPHIDRLCNEGILFTNYYSAQAVSSASRAGLLTGCYPNRIGFYGALSPNSERGINEDEETIAEVLKKKDYVCSIIGKWHLGDHFQFLPLQHGFDEYFGLPYSNDMWPYHPQTKFPELPLIEGNEIVNPNVRPVDQEQLTTWYTKKAVDFIKTNQDNPFFLYLAHSMPHVPLYVSDKFKGKSKQGVYGDVMMEIDWSVGEILQILKELQLDKNTLIVFTSDNGPWINYGNHAGSTGGLREGKGSTFEGGQRVPCIMRWTDKIPAGISVNQLASSIDLLPTFAEISEAPLPENKIDGVSLKKLILEDLQDEPRSHFLYYYRKNNLEAVRNDQFKLVLPHNGRSYESFLPGIDGLPGKVNENTPVGLALYDLRRDPGERYNVYEQFPDVVEELMGIVQEAREDLGDNLTGLPGKNRRPGGILKK